MPGWLYGKLPYSNMVIPPGLSFAKIETKNTAAGIGRDIDFRARALFGFA